MYRVILVHTYKLTPSSNVKTEDFLLYDSLCINEYDKQIQSPTLTIDKEGGSFSFTVSKEHYTWALFENRSIMKRTSQIIIYENDEWLWEGCIVDYSKDYAGNFKIDCSGALQYLKNTTLPLSNIVNVKKPLTQGNDGFFKSVFKIFMQKIVTQHNERINDLDASTVGYSVESVLRHQKIYFVDQLFDGYAPIIVDPNAIPPDHFSRIVNFETCYDALQKRIADDFGGFFYLIKEKVTVDSDLRDQDSTLTIGEQREVLLLRYRMIPKDSQDKFVAYLGHNLLDYNISEDFDLATAAIPLGDSYDENHPGDSRWWFKDERSVFFDISQRANYAWRTTAQTESGRTYPIGGSRIFLPSTVDGAHDIVSKYGMRDVTVEFDTVVAKYPHIPQWNGNWQDYKAGDLVLYTYTDGGGTVHPNVCFVVLQDHTSRPSITPSGTQSWYTEAPSNHLTFWQYYYSIKHPGQTIPTSQEKIEWESKNDYLGDTNDYRIGIYETSTGDTLYRTDYMKALKVLAIDYLTNQQFDKLVLDISANKISSSDDEVFDALHSFGTKIPVSASLFGENLKQYEVTGVTLQLNDDSQSRLTLGGEETKITKLINTK